MSNLFFCLITTEQREDPFAWRDLLFFRSENMREHYWKFIDIFKKIQTELVQFKPLNGLIC